MAVWLVGFKAYQIHLGYLMPKFMFLFYEKLFASGNYDGYLQLGFQILNTNNLDSYMVSGIPI